MHQDRDEPIWNFGAHIRGQARICKYSTKCQGCELDVSFMEEILRDVLIRGIADQEIQMEVLGHSNQNPSFEEALRIIEAKEAGKRSASSLLDTNGAEAMQTSSSYKKEQKSHPDEPCGYFGRIGHGKRDFIPVHPGRYKPHITWQETLALRKGALRNRHMRGAEQWSEHTKRLPPLVVGDHVRLQNQVGLNPKKWDYTGVVVEVRQFDQYVIRVDGSGRVTLRNKRFLRKYEPYNPTRQVHSVGPDLALWRAQSSTPVYPTLTSPNTTAPSDDAAPVPPANCTACPPHGTAVQTTTGPQNSPDDHDGATPPNAAYPGDLPPRRSTRPTHRPAWHQDFDMM
ncbi:hypothetical protein CAPTEDRAFT_190650 [Capitella teleta]|uniref:Uncharacterized protein n=1 Tax=Capitella teleta TaxID=283909 RepID=R7TCN7_CAPTE|nr:hypothetical protein CAPTEDRAFT_190650 [Capitella teleta]|eukprot:ELT88836.1 hypothetical protein CAPTEDRAFT_190650 [Capitella teleta]